MLCVLFLRNLDPRTDSRCEEDHAVDWDASFLTF